MSGLTTIILAAGYGKRMVSQLPKVLHEVSGKPMVTHVIDLAQRLNSEKTVVVIGHGKEQVKEALSNKSVCFVEQNEQLGTGHAVLMAKAYIETGDVLVLFGDTPLLTEKTLSAFIAYHKNAGHTASLMSMCYDNPHGYGRILRDENGGFLRIVEQKDTTEEEARIKEVNSGIGIFNARALKEALQALKNDNNQGEYYLTDAFEMIKCAGKSVGAYISDDADELMGVNDRVALAYADSIMQKRIIEDMMRKGVTFLKPETSYLGSDVTIGQDTIVLPGTVLMGKTTIGTNSQIGPNADLMDVTIGSYVTVAHSTLRKSSVDDHSAIGPYAYLRPGSRIGKHVKIGDFVEVKNSIIGNHSKVSHLSYVGDGEVGEGVNLGCGVVFVNYDGVNKHLTKVESGAFVGCNSNLVAPVTIGENAYVAAGSTITEDVPAEALAIARQRQVNKTEWSNKYKKGE